MDPKRIASSTAGAVTAALTTQGATITTLSQGTDIPAATLRSRLAQRTEFTWGELLTVGAFLRIHPATLMAGPA
jgi:hypothetical protein